MKINKSLIADSALLLVAIVWGSGFVVMKNALADLTPYYIMAIRFTIAALILIVLYHKKLKQIQRRDLISGGIVGFFLFTAFAAQSVGLQYTTASKQAFLTGINVVMVPFLYWMVNRKRPDNYEFSATFIAVLGVGLLTLNGGALVLGYGDVLTLLCAVLFAAHITATGYFAAERDPYVLATLQIVVAAVLSVIFALSFETAPETLTPNALFGTVYLGLFSTCMAFLFQTVAQKYTTSTHAALILCTEALFGTLLSVWFLKEVLSGKMIVGCVMIFLAIVTAETKWKFLIPNRNGKEAA